MKQPNGQPPANDWRDKFGTITGAVIAFEHGAIQFVGERRDRIKIIGHANEDVVAVPFAVLFSLVGQVLGMLDASHPLHQAARAVLFAPPGVLATRPDMVESTLQTNGNGTPRDPTQRDILDELEH